MKLEERANSNKNTASKASADFFISPEGAFDLLLSLLEHRNLDDPTHILRIRSYTRLLLESMYAKKNELFQLTPEEIEIYASASLLHDIGKITVRDDILLKKGMLTALERENMKLHCIKGAQIIEKLAPFMDARYAKACHDICLHHHERWDGAGYPDQLAGGNIPLAARVVALADVYDAITSVKPYKPRLSHKTAVDMIENGDRGMFDPNILDCFKLIKGKFKKISVAHFGPFKMEDILTGKETAR